MIFISHHNREKELLCSIFQNEKLRLKEGKLPKDIQQSMIGSGFFPLQHNTSPWAMDISALRGGELPITGGIQRGRVTQWGYWRPDFSSVRKIQLEAHCTPRQLGISMIL
jgi:hypothetical protein